MATRGRSVRGWVSCIARAAAWLSARPAAVPSPAVKTTGGSTHFDGFILNTNYSSADNSINDFLTTLDKGIPWGDKGLPPSAASLPFVDPTLTNNRNVYFWQRSDSGRPGTNDTWTLDIQKQLTGRWRSPSGYSGPEGHAPIASALDRFNQIPMALLDKYGRTLLNSSINSPAARAANIPIPYAGFGSSSPLTPCSARLARSRNTPPSLPTAASPPRSASAPATPPIMRW